AGLIWTFYNVAFIVILAFGPDLLSAYGYTATTAAAVVSTVSWVVIVALPFGGWLADRIGRPNTVMLVSFAGTAIIVWLVARFGASMLVFLAMGLLFAPPGGMIMALPGEAVRAERRAIAMGIYFTCYYAGMGVLPALAGYARDLTADPSAPYWY